MATFRLGSTCSSTRSPGDSKQSCEANSGDGCDPNKLFQCPYDKNHQIRGCRFPYHLIKCRKNHPKLAMELKTCPFNARHLMPKEELSHHITNCADRQSVNTKDVGHTQVDDKWQVPVNTWVAPRCEEDWDEETADVPTSTFIWGVSTSELLNRPEPSTTTNLIPGLRAPKTLPWKMYC